MIFMKPRLWLAVILTAGLFLAQSCGSRNGVEVNSRNFDTEVDQQQNLQFAFNKDLYPDSLLQQWDSIPYLEFKPAVRGMYKWNSSSELQFSPAEGFLPGTEYTAVITRQVLRYSKKPYPLGKETKFKFHTAPLHVAATQLSYERGAGGGNVMTRLDLNFNYDVQVTDAAAKVKLSSNGRPVSFNAVNGGKGKTVSLQFLPLTGEDKPVPIKIEIAKGVKLATTAYQSATDTLIEAEVPSRYTLSITGIASQHSGTEATVTLSTSQPVAEEGLKNYISLEPAVIFEAQAAEGGITLTSTEMKPDQTYQVTVARGLEGTFGGRMKSSYSEQVTFGKLAPTIDFNNTKGMYLSSRGYKNLALNIVNVPKVEVTVTKVYENNIEQLIGRGRSGDYAYDDEGNEGGSYETYNTANLGDTIFHQDYETAKLPGFNAARVLHLDFQDKIKSYNGVYVITVASKEHYWVQQSKILSISDIGMIVKEEKDNIYVFTNSIHDAAPMSGVRVSFVSTNNQQLYTTTTDGDGIAVFKDMRKQSPGFKTGMITAKSGDEFSFLWMDGSRIETSRYDVGGREPNATGLSAMIYAERNLYRPGEIAHISTIVRDESWNNPGEIPVRLRLMMPNGKEFASMRKILNEEGSCETVFPIPPTALTGTYTLEVYSGNNILLNSYPISIEDFMPDRMKAALKINQPEYNLGDSVRATIQADNLFGTPAMNRNFECELNLEKVSFSSDKYDSYSFTISKDFSFSTQFQNGNTDERGSARAAFSLSPEYAEAGLIKGNVRATVFDETGRPVHRYEHFKVYTQPVFIGIKEGYDYVNTRAQIRIPLIALNKAGVPQNGVLAQVQVIRTEWNTVIEQSGDHYRYVSQEQRKVVSQQGITINGEGTSFSYVPMLSGSYEVQVLLPGHEGYVSKSFYAWGYSDSQYTSFEVNNEGNVDIRPDKEKYNLGEEVKLLFTTPFEGRMLVTVERDKLLKHYYVTTSSKSASLSFKADDLCVPNVYITATLFRPMDGTDMPLTVAHGFRNIPVENVRNHLPLTVSVAPESRSKTTQAVTVKTTPGAYVTIAAVDEGILQVKNYETPDPYSYFYQKVALSMMSYDIYPLLLPEIKTTRSSTGGDGAGANSNLRVNPLFVNRVKNVSFWSGIVQADGSGTVRYNIDVPQFSGDIRVMAVAYKGKGFAGADQHMKVADPIVISTALPRVLSPRDEVVMPVTLSNTTPKDAVATISVQVGGPLNVAGQNVQRITIPANREARAVFNVVAQNSIGAGKVMVQVQAMNETFTNETEIGVRPPASLQKLTGSGTAPAGVVTSIVPAANFLPGTASGKLIIGKSPLVPFSKNMEYLVHYPYGCVEQTISAAFPQLYYADLVKSITGANVNDPNPNYNVQQAILKLQSMQLSNGALMYWPSGGSESWWGSVYAAHFLLEAKKAGYEVNVTTLDHLLQYLRFRLQKRETEVLYYNQNLKKEIAAKEVAYSLYVLALAGQPQTATMNYYKGSPGILAIDSKYLLAAAYGLSGNPQAARQVLPAAFAGEKANKAFGGSFYSHIRDAGLALGALVDIDPGNPQIGSLGRTVSSMMRGQYLNTQENVWGILALGKIARTANATNATAAVSSGSKQLGTSTGAAITMDLKPYINKPLQLQVKGKGNYYYFWETSGITADGSYKEEDSYLKVRRTYYDRNGTPIAGNTFRQNDLIVIRLTLQAQFNTDVENVVVTDMLPAGFEIENTRLNDMQGMKWIKEEATPDYLDYRDDRLNLFTTATGTEKSFYYMVRAVSPGLYQLGPVQADAMYNGFFHSYNGAGVVRIN
jgi:uncharacterized protein YfaS (alpha-2-macroglobulin family)